MLTASRWCVFETEIHDKSRTICAYRIRYVATNKFSVESHFVSMKRIRAMNLITRTVLWNIIPPEYT